MAAALTPQEELAVKEFISIANELRLQQNAGPLSWSTAVKFMMARKFDIRRALHLYEAHEILRKREGLYKFDPTNGPLRSELETKKFTILPTRDRGGAALALFNAGKHDPFLSSHQTTLQGIVYQLDVALERLNRFVAAIWPSLTDTMLLFTSEQTDFYRHEMAFRKMPVAIYGGQPVAECIETQRYGIVFIYNMHESKYANFDYELSQKMLTLLKGCYPARLKKVLIVTAPLWFKAPFKILRLFVREKLRDRVYMVNIPQLADHIPASSLPEELGGSLKMDHNSWLLHCLKSMANRGEDISTLISAPTSPSAFPNGHVFPNILQHKGLNGAYLNMNSEGETDESSDHQCSVHEKQNTEDREKEVEVTKESEVVPEEVIPLGPQENGFADDLVYSSTTPSSSLSNDSLHGESGQGLTLEEFIEHLQKKGKKGLYKEYAEIKAKGPEGSFECSRLKSNQPKNRYTDVLCYDHTRVKLSSVESDECSDYLNANFVDGYKQKSAFISTQGPLPNTFSDFWKMVWEQQVAVIVMTTRTIERSRVKCGQYWPQEEGTSAEHGSFLVYNENVEHFADYIVTSLVLTNTKVGKYFKVIHMQFTSWPDFGVPHSALAMLDFRDKVREKQAQCAANLGSQWQGHPQGPPIIVHCSAGIGRTGTFITLDICICRLEATGLVDVRTTVEKIRSQRAYSIQMPDQYVFCHLALLEFALSRGLLHDVDLSSFNDSDSDSE